MTGLSTPAFLVDEEGMLAFYNDAAGALLGRRFEEAGRMQPEEWGTEFGPFDPAGRQIPFDELPLTIALRRGRSAHSRFSIRSDKGDVHEIEVTAFPVVGRSGPRGAVAIFWDRSD
jgi:PAS domain-containing protein